MKNFTRCFVLLLKLTLIAMYRYSTQFGFFKTFLASGRDISRYGVVTADEAVSKDAGIH